MMRAWEMQQHGMPPVLVERDAPQADGAALVEVTAAPITPLDLLTASGTSYFGPPALPYIPGVQGVGRLSDGTRVWFTTDAGMQPGDGSMAEIAAVAKSRLWPIAVDVPDAVVAGLGLSAVAAHGALRRGRFAAGDRVLVLAGGGVVGGVALQLARIWGAESVIAMCRGESDSQRARDLGAEAVVDTAGLEMAEVRQALAEAAGDGVDLVIDPLWGAPAEAALSVLVPGGRLVNIGDTAGPSATFTSAAVRSRSIDLLGYTNLAQTWAEQTAAMSEILHHVADGQLRFDPEVVAMEQGAEGWQRQAEQRNRSRVVVEVRSSW